MSSTSMRTHLCGDLRPDQIGETVSVCGWVGRRREHGEHLAFVDLRDHSGIVQCVINDDVDVRSEYVLRITGVVRERPEGTINDNAADRPRRDRRLRGRDPAGRDAAAVPDRRAGRRRRREHPPAVPLSRPAPRADAEEPADPVDDQRCGAHRRWTRRASSRSRRRCSSRRHPRAPASSSCRRARSPARSTPCRSRRSCSSSC